MTCINWVKVRNGARPGPFRGWRSSSGSLDERSPLAWRGRCSIFLSRKKGQTSRGFPLSWRSMEPRIQLWRWAWIPVAQWSVQRFRSEKQLGVRRNSDYSHRRPSRVHGWQSLPVWPPIKDKFTLLCWKKEERKDNLHHSSAQIWQCRIKVDVWKLAIPPLRDCCIGLSFHAYCLDDCECHGQLSLHNVMWFYLTVPLNTL